MALNIGDNFSYLGAKPLDARRVFASKDALDAVNLSTVYEGMVAYAKLEDKYYRLKSGVWVEFQSGSGITDWVASTSYSVGQYVNYSGSLYKCTTANNDATFTASHWQQISGGAGIANWASNTSYVVGTLVIYNDKIYECTAAHTSSTTFDATKWKEISASAGGIANWATNKSYNVGDLVINSNKIYQCNTAHTSGSTFNSTEEAYWDKIVGGGAEINNWATSTQYKVGDLVIRENNLYRCKTAHTSSAFNTDIANWIKLDNIPDWASSKDYFVDDLVTYSNNVYKCVTAHTSASTFDKSKWQILGMTVTAPIKVGEVGFVSWQYALMTDNLALDGSTINNFSANYPELYNFFNTNGVLTTTLATYAANKALCYYDSTNDEATMPDFLDKTVWGGTTITEKSAGLPNITGHTGINGASTATWLADNGYSGALKPELRGTDTYMLGNAIASNAGNFDTITLDASKSNSIYGNSQTVQPPAIQLIPQIRYRKEVVEGSFEEYGNSPIGTVISYMGTTPPEEYLACDGTTYNIVDYWELAEFINTQFGSYNYFGGDGTTTFAVPDLRGEFLRGTGTNSRSGQGSGDNVGTHQNATILNDIWKFNNNLYFTRTMTNRQTNVDSFIASGGSRTFVSGSANENDSNPYTMITARPTNTSVLYCIKYTNSLIMQPANNYSTTEKRIGTWIDGSPLYQKTIVGTMPIVTTNGTRTNKQIDISDLTISACISVDGVYYVPSQLEYIPINSAVNLTTNTRHTFCQVYRQNSSNSYIDTIFIASSDANSSGATAYITLKYTKL